MSERDRLPVLDLLRRVEPLRQDMTITEAAARIAAAGTGLPVADADGKLIGYLGEQDLLQALIPGYLRELHDTDFLTRDLSTLTRCVAAAAETQVSDHMSTEPAYVDTDDSEMHAAELFLHRRVRSLPVVDQTARVQGVLRLGDLIADLMRRHDDAGSGDATETGPTR